MRIIENFLLFFDFLFADHAAGYTASQAQPEAASYDLQHETPVEVEQEQEIVEHRDAEINRNDEDGHDDDGPIQTPQPAIKETPDSADDHGGPDREHDDGQSEDPPQNWENAAGPKPSSRDDQPVHDAIGAGENDEKSSTDDHSNTHHQPVDTENEAPPDQPYDVPDPSEFTPTTGEEFLGSPQVVSYGPPAENTGQPAPEFFPTTGEDFLGIPLVYVAEEPLTDDMDSDFDLLDLFL